MNRIILFLLTAILVTSGCKSSNTPVTTTPDVMTTNAGGEGRELTILFKRGPEHNHPLMAIWAEDTSGSYIQTLYVAKSIAKGVFEHGDNSTGKWMPGEIRRPAALPVWSHARGVREKDGLYIPTPETAIPDAYTGPTPQQDFILQTRLDEQQPGGFFLLFEINQTWDWNEYWTNNRYPDNEEYKTSCQPSLVYRTYIDPDNEKESFELELIGRGHESGENGRIYTDHRETMTTALEITEKISVKTGQP